MLTAVRSSGERVIRYEAAWRQLTPESCEALGEGGVGPSGDNGYIAAAHGAAAEHGVSSHRRRCEHRYNASRLTAADFRGPPPEVGSYAYDAAAAIALAIQNCSSNGTDGALRDHAAAAARGQELAAAIRGLAFSGASGEVGL